GLVQHRAAVTRRAEACFCDGVKGSVLEEAPAALFRLGATRRQYGSGSAFGETPEFGRAEEPRGQLEFGDAPKVFFVRLLGVLKVVVDRTQGLAGKVGLTPVKHQHRVERGRVPNLTSQAL